MKICKFDFFEHNKFGRDYHYPIEQSLVGNLNFPLDLRLIHLDG